MISKTFTVAAAALMCMAGMASCSSDHHDGWRDSQGVWHDGTSMDSSSTSGWRDSQGVWHDGKNMSSDGMNNAGGWRDSQGMWHDGKSMNSGGMNTTNGWRDSQGVWHNGSSSGAMNSGTNSGMNDGMNGNMRGGMSSASTGHNEPMSAGASTTTYQSSSSMNQSGGRTMGMNDKHHRMMHENMQTVNTTDLPPAVNAAMQREAMGNSVTNTSKYTMNGKTMYEGSSMMNGTAYKICVDADGNLVAKHRADWMTSAEWPSDATEGTTR